LKSRFGHSLGLLGSGAGYRRDFGHVPEQSEPVRVPRMTALVVRDCGKYPMLRDSADWFRPSDQEAAKAAGTAPAAQWLDGPSRSTNFSICPSTDGSPPIAAFRRA
jgi:hypothetical protein